MLFVFVHGRIRIFLFFHKKFSLDIKAATFHELLFFWATK